jgi:polysaccharide biosynthesis/export protein
MQMPRLAILAAAFILAGAGTAVAQSTPGSFATAALNAPATAPLSSEAYRIGPQDVIEVDVFQIPDLSKAVEVDAAGRVRLPLLGDVQAAGRTTSEFASFLEAELRKTYVKDPKVSVTMKQSSSRRVTVDGAVVQPGVYPLGGPTTLIQALALARGPDPREANIRRVALMRNVDGRRVSSIHDLSAIRNGKAVDPEVRPDDIIVVDASRGRSLLRDIGSMLPILGWLRPF